MQRIVQRAVQCVSPEQDNKLLINDKEEIGYSQKNLKAGKIVAGLCFISIMMQSH